MQLCHSPKRDSRHSTDTSSRNSPRHARYKCHHAANRCHRQRPVRGKHRLCWIRPAKHCKSARHDAANGRVSSTNDSISSYPGSTCRGSPCRCREPGSCLVLPRRMDQYGCATVQNSGGSNCITKCKKRTQNGAHEGGHTQRTQRNSG